MATDSSTDSASTDSGVNPEPDPHHLVLIPGFWLGGWAWHEVEPGLRTAGLTPHAVTLPGLGEAGSTVTLADRIDHVAALVEDLSGRVTLVGHSGGAPVAQGVADRLTDRIERVVYVDSGPMADGIVLRPDETADVALPSWEQLATEQCSLEGVDDQVLSSIRERAGTEPVGVATAPVRLSNDQRFAVPVSVICTSIPSELLQQLIEAGQIPSELLAVQDVRFVDLPTGHWPMFSRPEDLARAMANEIERR